MKENVHPTEVASSQQESTEGSSSNIASKRLPPRKSLIPVPSPPKKEKVNYLNSTKSMSLSNMCVVLIQRSLNEKLLLQFSHLVKTASAAKC